MTLRTMFFAVATSAALAACSQQDKKPRLPQSAVVGLWRSDSSAGASRYTLQMDSGGLAAFTSQAAGAQAVTERGTWDGADSLVRVVVRGAQTASRPTSLLMSIRGNTLQLVQFDTTAWGSDGLTLSRR